MIIVKLTGGLGNQMFQYAFARSLAENKNTELFIDNSFFNRPFYINYFLKCGTKIINFNSKISNKFNLNVLLDLSKYIQPSHEKYSLNCFNLNNTILTKKSLSTLKRKHDIHFYDYSSPLKTMELEKLKNIETPAYIVGLWQSEKYFIENEEIIRKDFEFKYPLKGLNKEIKEDILNNESVAIHIRKGDFLKHPEVGICTLDYYNKAIKYLIDNLNNPKFFIFSDNPKWVKENIKISKPSYYVSNNSSDKGYNDLHLMSLCKHFIIANSSFSWWGAWLSKNKNKIVIKPNPWQFSRIMKVSDISSKKCIKISNDYSNLYNNSKEILFKLKTIEDLKKITKNKENIKITKNEHNFLFLNTMNKKSKIFFENLNKKSEENNIIIKFVFKSNLRGMLRLLYLTTDSKIYSETKSFPVLFEKDEELTIYFPLSHEILLNSLILIPSNKPNTKMIIKEMEIREINYKKGFY